MKKNINNPGLLRQEIESNKYQLTAIEENNKNLNLILSEIKSAKTFRAWQYYNKIKRLVIKIFTYPQSILDRVASNRQIDKSYNEKDHNNITIKNANKTLNFPDSNSQNIESFMSFQPEPWEIALPTILTTEKQIWSNRENLLNTKQLITVIVPAANTVPAHFLFQALLSIKAQSYSRIQVCLIIENKTVWSVESIQRQFKNNPIELKIVRLPVVDLSYQTLQASVPNVDGTYVTWLYPYDALTPDALLMVAEYLDRNSVIDIVYSSAANQDNVKSFRIYTDADNLSRLLYPNDFSWNQLVVYRTGYITANNLFKKKITTFLRRQFQKEISSKIVHKQLYLKRRIPSSSSFGIFDSNRNNRVLELFIMKVGINICVDARLINRKITGTERYITELLRALSKFQEREILHISAIVYEKPNLTIKGIHWIKSNHLEAIQNSDVFHKTFPVSNIPSLKELPIANTILYTPLDLINFSNPSYFDDENNYSFFRTLLKCSCDIADKIIALSEAGKIDICSKMGITERKVETIHLGILLKDFNGTPTLKDRQAKKVLKLPKHYFFSLGTNYPHKNLITLFRAFKDVVTTFPNHYLVTAGVNYFPYHQPEIEQAKKALGKHLIELGYVDDKFIPSLYRQSTALVYPSLYEGFGFPILEAMACRTAVVASNATSIPEISGKRNALLVDASSPQKLSKALIRLISQKNLRAELISRSEKWANHFTWERTAEAIVSCYKQIISQNMALYDPNTKEKRLQKIQYQVLDVPTVLIVTHVRFFPPSAGNELRIFKLIKYLKKQGFRIVVLVNPFLERENISSQHLFDVHQWVDHYEELKKEQLNEENIFIPFKTEFILRKLQDKENLYCPDLMIQKSSELIRIYKPEVIISEYIWTSRVLQIANEGMLKIIDLHDDFSHRKDSLSITKAQEKTFINRADVAMAIQPLEANMFRKLATSCKIIATGVDFDVTNSYSLNKKSQTSTILIVASNNPSNRQCITEFIRNVFPRVRAKYSQATLRIVGKVIVELQEFNQQQFLELIPYVTDIHLEYENAVVVVNPVYEGTGLKIKSVEAIAHGKALIAYPEGIAGLESNQREAPFICVENERAMFNSIVSVLRDRVKRKSLETRAKKYAEVFFSEQHVYHELREIISAKTWPALRLHVVCLYVRYGTKEYANSLKKLAEWYREYLPQYDFEIWIIDNQLSESFSGLDLNTGYKLFGGDNSQWEFSAWNKILIKYKNEISAFDLIHFVTAAFDNLYTDYTLKFTPQQLIQVAQDTICVGHLDCYDHPIQIDTKVSQNWVRTCFFFLSPKTAYTMSSFIRFKQTKDFFNKNATFLLKSRISKNYQRYIVNWLSGKSMQGVHWHKTVNDKKGFMLKALAILNEHGLTLTMRQNGVHIVDISWWSDVKKKVYLNIGTLPDEMKQIRTRRK